MKMSPASRAFRRSSSEADFRDDEAEAVAVHGEPSNRQILSRSGLRQGKTAGIDLYQLTFGNQLFQALG